MNKDNILFQLDLLQAYFHNQKSRYPKTYQIIKAYKYNNEAKHTHKLLKLSRNEAETKIKELSETAFERKFHGIQSKLVKQLVKVLKKEKQKLTSKKKSTKNDNSDQIDNQLKAVDLLLSTKNEGLLIDNVHHKLVKTILKLYPELSSSFIIVPQWFANDIDNLKEQNPYKTNSKEVNDVLSKAFSDKEVKGELDITGFEIVWKRKNREYNDGEAEEEEEEEEEEVENDDLDEEDSEEETSARSKQTDNDLSDEDVEEYFDAYKDAIAASSDEESENELDPSVNYNEITDEEPSEDEGDEDDENDNNEDDSEQRAKLKRSIEEDDDFFTSDEPKSKKAKNALPALATGYYSGGESDDEVDNDKMVQEVTTQRKNRRGQRARQKIWEKKYGKTAKHVVKNQEREKSEKERLKYEYEQRKAKREQRESNYATRKRELDAKKKEQEARIQKLGIHHPSWEAKRLAEQKLKNVKFEGKKMTFD